MAPPAHMERALTSSGVKLSCGPVMATAARRAFVTLLLRIEAHFLLWKNADQGGVAGGSVVCTAPNGCHCTRPGVYCGAVADGFTFDSVLLSSEEETDVGGPGAFLWGGGGGWGWLGANVELDVLDW